MSNKLNSETPSRIDPLPLDPAETETLLQTVNQKIASQTFDPNDNQLLKRMVESLGDTRGMVRLGFAEALGVVGQPATPFLLVALAGHPNPVVRRAAAKTLTLIADPSAIPTLVNAFLNDPDTVVKGSTAGALARTGQPAVSPLLEILASPQHPENIKGLAAWALAFIGVAGKEQLYDASTSDSATVRGAVVGAIANFAEEHPDDQAFEILIHALNDPAEMVRTEAATTLGKLAHQPAMPHLIELLHHSDSESRTAAALALMKMGDRTALESLQAALTQESDAAVQRAIQLAISQIERYSEEDTWE